jgi:hypothetical protein
VDVLVSPILVADMVAAPSWPGGLACRGAVGGRQVHRYLLDQRGRLDDHQQWALGANYRLHAEGRGSYRGAGHDPLEQRRHIFTSFSDYLGPTYRDDDVPRDLHTLVQPYQGLVVQVIDSIDGDRAGLDAWLDAEYLPSVVGGPVAVSMRFAPRPLPGDKLAHVRELDGVEHIVTVLHFLEVDPRECWEERFASSSRTLAAAGVGSLAMQAAFIPTRHGTNDYTDELF